MKIAIIGHRGVPANYGGFETFAEEIGIRLAGLGHQVFAYCRTNNVAYRRKIYKGIKLIHLPTIPTKFFDTIAHSALSVAHIIFKNRVDIVLMVNVGNAPVSFLPRLFGMPVVLNVDGLEWERKKWPWLAKNYLRTCSYLVKWLPTWLVTDAQVIYDFYKHQRKKESTMIPYGTVIKRRPYPNLLRKYGLKEEDYFLYVSRFEPENNVYEVVKAFEKSNAKKKLVIVGDATYNSEYKQQVMSTQDPRIKFLGFVYGRDYKALQQNAYAYIHATEVGGTHPALIEGMGYGNCVLALNTPENMEVTNGAAITFTFAGKIKTKHHDLCKKIQQIADQPRLRSKFQKRAIKRVKKTYQWEEVTRGYTELFAKLLTKSVEESILIKKSKLID